MLTWRELLDETLRAGGHSMGELAEEGAIGDALWEIGSVWDRASVAQEFPDSEAPALDDDTGLLVEAAVDRVLERLWDDEEVPS